MRDEALQLPKPVKLLVSGVEDLAGNKMIEDAEFNFDFSKSEN